ncbi:MAG: glutaminyl-peptide cyclotransferase [Dehalococcoidia bacterium]|nr:glutaminyl-peptide cyclotransferase [Dehalococcoidia bacterium]
MSAHRLILAALFFFAGLLAACGGGGGSPAAPTETPQLEGEVELVGSMPHEGRAWTEGLLVSEGILWESTGLIGQSQVRGLDRQTGAVLWSAPNTEGVFGEGLVRAFGRTYLLTYTEGKAYLFERDGARPYTLFATYEGEGWGLTATDQHLVNSNGSATLYYRDPETFSIVREVPIQYVGQPVQRLNELEFDGTYIWANQWRTPYIYRILERDPSKVVRYTLPAEVCPGGSPNGIAWDEDEGIFFLTGQTCEKIWKARLR